MKQPVYSYSDGTASCIMYYDNKEFIGTTSCYPEDEDMESSLTGYYIAEMRALLKVLKYKKNYEMRPQLSSLNQLWYTMNSSKQFNRQGYEAKMLRRQIKMYEEDIKAIKEEIAFIEKSIKTFIDEKDILYKRLRKLRGEK